MCDGNLVGRVSENRVAEAAPPCGRAEAEVENAGTDLRLRAKDLFSTWTNNSRGVL